MENNSNYVYRNVYGNTLEKIIEDFQTQIRDYRDIKELLDSNDIDNLKVMIAEESIAIETFNGCYAGKKLERVDITSIKHLL